MSSVLARTGRLRQRYENNLRLVSGCIPYRLRKEDKDHSGDMENRIEVLMVSSPKRDDLVFPKGGWEDDETVEEAACREALEESGVKGILKTDPLGVWEFRSKSRQESCSLEGGCRGYMFALEVTEELETWPEQGNRARKWLNIKDASRLCRYDWMRGALEEFKRVMTEDGKLKMTEEIVEPTSMTVSDVVADCQIISSNCYVKPSSSQHNDLAFMDPGPSDGTVLYRQALHRSTHVWDTHNTSNLICQHRELTLHKTIPLDPRIVPFLQQAGLYGLSRVGFIKLDHPLITALVERWRPETHTFHLPQGECTITLEDVSIQLGLPVDGLPVTGSTDVDWSELCADMLGVRPPDDALQGSRLRISWIHMAFPKLPDDADELMLQRYARAYILQLFGGCLFADKSSSHVHLMFLPLLQDFGVAGRYSWGAAGLAWLYRELCWATRPDVQQIAGPLILLQLWAWDRLPHMLPCRLLTRQHDPVMDGVSGVELPRGPLGMRWRDDFSITEVSTHVLHYYRYQLDQQSQDQMIWQPYTSGVTTTLPDYCFVGQQIWRSVSPLICFHIIEWHRPNRVLRQFGFQQLIPNACNTDMKLHEIDLKGQEKKNWDVFHRKYVDLWAHRRDHVIDGQPITGSMHYNDPYMLWYRRITRRFISRVGAMFNYLTDSLVHIHQFAGDQHTPTSSSVIQRTCTDVLRVVKEHHRLLFGIPLASTATHDSISPTTSISSTIQQPITSTPPSPTISPTIVSTPVIPHTPFTHLTTPPITSIPIISPIAPTQPSPATVSSTATTQEDASQDMEGVATHEGDGVLLTGEGEGIVVTQEGEGTALVGKGVSVTHDMSTSETMGEGGRVTQFGILQAMDVVPRAPRSYRPHPRHVTHLTSTAAETVETAPADQDIHHPRHMYTYSRLTPCKRKAPSCDT